MIVEDEQTLHQLIQKGQIINFKHFINYEHFKALLSLCGQDGRLNEVRLAMSHEYFNKLNLVMYQLWCEIHFKGVKHATIFNQMTDEDGFVKKSDFIMTIAKYSILSQS
jgi:hypothetical protein